MSSETRKQIAERALGLVDLWPNWAGGKLVLAGPAGAGKTHLTHV